jgi:hypothetical protein
MDTALPPLPPDALPQPPPPSDAGLPTNQRDLYCPGCGYNLRGLPGDPIRCPECGRMCPLREVELPAAMIKRRLVRLESASAYSVFFLYGAIGAVLFALSNASLSAPGGTSMAPCGLVGCIFGLAAALAVSRRSCDAHPDWPLALAQYHFFGLLMFGGAFGMVMLYHRLFTATIGFSPRPIGGVSTASAYLMGLGVTLIACGFWTAWTYRRAVAHLRLLQRDVAVRIAREEWARHGRRRVEW